MICKFPTPFLVLHIVKICLNITTTMMVHVNGGDDGGDGGGVGGGGGVIYPDLLCMCPQKLMTSERGTSLELL
jgi:hypothetical protein